MRMKIAVGLVTFIHAANALCQYSASKKDLNNLILNAVLTKVDDISLPLSLSLTELPVN